MKKVFALLLALLMVLALTACGEETPAPSTPSTPSTPSSGGSNDDQPPADLYELLATDDIFGDIAAGTGLVMDMDLEFEVDMGGTKTTAQGQLSLQATDLDLTKAVMQLAASLQLAGEQMAFNLYYEDGFAYIEMDGEKTRVAVDLGSDEDSDISFDIASLSEEFKAVLKAAKVRSGELGYSYALTFKADMLGSAWQSLISLLPQEGDLALIAPLLEGVSLGDIGLTVTVTPDIKRVAFLAQGGAAMSAGDAQQDIACTFEVELAVQLEQVNIKAPTDLGEYQRQLTEDDYQLIYGMLFDAEGNLIENNEIAYNLMCSEYGKDTVDAFIELMQQAMQA